MQPIKITVSSTRAVCSERPDPITTGMVGLRAEFIFSDDWDGLQKTAVCAGSGVTKDVLVVQDEITVPHECLTDPASDLKIGLYGTNSTGNIVIPTVYAYCGRLFRGADPSGDTSTDYTLPIWAQIQAMIGDLSNLTTTARDNLVAAINEAAKSGGGGGGTAADVRMQVAGGYIQYSTDGGTTWRNLIAMEDLIGEECVGIQSVEQTTTSTEDSGINVITVTKTDGATSTFEVRNGGKGGAGKSAYQYAQDGGYTGTEAEFSARMAAEIPSVDSTLTQSGQAADAATVGERLSALSEEIANLQTSGLTTAQVNALDGMFKVCAFIKADISAEYNAFCTAFGIEAATITGISATYSGGNVAVGTAVTDLTGIVVTANYSDGSKRTVTGYTLSGTIAEGSNTITVTYEGMTTTFTVTGVAEEVTITSISATYSGGDVAVGTAVTDLTGIVVTATYSDGSTATVTGYTLNGTIAEGENTVTVSYGGKTTTFVVTGVAESGGDEPVDTTAKIAGTGYGLNKQGELEPREQACYTEFYSFGRTIEGNDSRKVIYYVSSNNEGGMTDANSQQVWQNDAFVTYWTTAYDTESSNNFGGNYGPFNRIRFPLVTAYIDDDYAYFADTGEVIFAGKNTPYYGMANIDGTMAVNV